MTVLWLRYLTEIDPNTQEVPADLLEAPEIGDAVNELKVSGFTEAELRAYDKFWDSVMVEKTIADDNYQEGMAKGRAEGELSKSLAIAHNMLASGMPDAQVVQFTGLTKEQVEGLKKC